MAVAITHAQRVKLENAKRPTHQEGRRVRSLSKDA
jgi:hypothetical protein